MGYDHTRTLIILPDQIKQSMSTNGRQRTSKSYLIGVCINWLHQNLAVQQKRGRSVLCKCIWMEERVMYVVYMAYMHMPIYIE